MTDSVKLSAADLHPQGQWQVPAAEATGDSDFGSTPTLFWGTVTPGGGTTTRDARYQLSIALNALGCDQSAIYCCFSDSLTLDTST